MCESTGEEEAERERRVVGTRKTLCLWQEGARSPTEDGPGKSEDIDDPVYKLQSQSTATAMVLAISEEKLLLFRTWKLHYPVAK